MKKIAHIIILIASLSAHGSDLSPIFKTHLTSLDFNNDGVADFKRSPKGSADFSFSYRNKNIRIEGRKLKDGVSYSVKRNNKKIKEYSRFVDERGFDATTVLEEFIGGNPTKNSLPNGWNGL